MGTRSGLWKSSSELGSTDAIEQTRRWRGASDLDDVSATTGRRLEKARGRGVVVNHLEAWAEALSALPRDCELPAPLVKRLARRVHRFQRALRGEQNKAGASASRRRCRSRATRCRGPRRSRRGRGSGNGRRRRRRPIALWRP